MAAHRFLDWQVGVRIPAPELRFRPEQLLADLRELSWVAIGRKYGVSDNAVRKWLRRYEAARDAQPAAMARAAA